MNYNQCTLVNPEDDNHWTREQLIKEFLWILRVDTGSHHGVQILPSSREGEPTLNVELAIASTNQAL